MNAYWGGYVNLDTCTLHTITVFTFWTLLLVLLFTEKTVLEIGLCLCPYVNTYSVGPNQKN
jgi:hypothetical protein